MQGKIRPLIRKLLLFYHFYSPVQFVLSDKLSSVQFFQHTDFKIQYQTRSVGHFNR